jgi:hypothetical protein
LRNADLPPTAIGAYSGKVGGKDTNSNQNHNILEK